MSETFFWSFCDDYLELVKDRAHGNNGESGAASAKATLALALSIQLRLFAPFLPFVTEEVWSWWQEGSVHLALWPTVDEVAIKGDADPQILSDTAVVLSGIRKAKSEAKLSMRTDVASAVVAGDADTVKRVAEAADDLRAAGRVLDLMFSPGIGEGLAVEVTL